MTTLGPASGNMRRSAFVAACGALVAAPAYVRAQTLTKIRIGATVQDDIAGVLWAAQSGIFEKYGLDVEVTRSNNGAAISAAVISGALDIGKSGVIALVTAHSRGLPFVVEAPSAVYTASAPTVTLLVAKNSPIKSGKDLNGSVVAVPALGDLFTLGISAWIDKHGGDSRTVKFLELPGTAQADAVAAGRVAACAMAEPLVTDSIRTGKCRFLAHPFDAIAPRFSATLLFAAADFAAKNADVLARFRKGVAEGVTYASAHHPEMLPMLAKFTGIDPAILATTVPTIVGTALDPRLIQPVIDAAVKYNVIPKAFSARDLIDPNA